MKMSIEGIVTLWVQGALEDLENEGIIRLENMKYKMSIRGINMFDQIDSFFIPTDTEIESVIKQMFNESTDIQGIKRLLTMYRDRKPDIKNKLISTAMLALWVAGSIIILYNEGKYNLKLEGENEIAPLYNVINKFYAPHDKHILAMTKAIYNIAGKVSDSEVKELTKLLVEYRDGQK